MRAMAEVQGSPRSLLSPPNCRDRPGSWQFPDKDASFVDDLDRQLVAVEHGHPDERISVGVHEDTTRTFVPDDLGLINVEEGFAPVRQNSSPLPAEWEIEHRDKRRRQGQEAAKPSVYDRLYLFSCLRPTDCQAEDCFPISIHRTGYHAGGSR